MSTGLSKLVRPLDLANRHCLMMVNPHPNSGQFCNFIEKRLGNKFAWNHVHRIYFKINKLFIRMHPLHRITHTPLDRVCKEGTHTLIPCVMFPFDIFKLIKGIPFFFLYNCFQCKKGTLFKNSDGISKSERQSTVCKLRTLFFSEIYL